MTINECMASLMPLLTSVLQINLCDDRGMERLCRIFKYAIKTAKIHIFPLLPSLIHTLLQAYQIQAHSVFLYTISICVDMFGAMPQFNSSGMLRSVLTTFTQHTLPLLSTAESFAQHPDLVEDYFQLCHRLLLRCPAVFFQTQQPQQQQSHQQQQQQQQQASLAAQQMFVTAMNGVTLHHRTALAAVMQFLTLYIQEGIEESKYHIKRIGQVDPVHVRIVQQSIEQYGQELANRLIQAIGGLLPPSRVQQTINVVMALMDVSPKGQEYIRNAVNSYPPSHQITHPSKDEFLESLFHASGPRFVREDLESFSKACRLQAGVEDSR